MDNNTTAEEQVLRCVPDLMIQCEQVSFINYLWIYGFVHDTFINYFYYFEPFKVRYLRNI